MMNKMRGLKDPRSDSEDENNSMSEENCGYQFNENTAAVNVSSPSNLEHLNEEYPPHQNLPDNSPRNTV